MTIELGFQPGRGPLPELTWRVVNGRRVYVFTDDHKQRCLFMEMTPGPTGEVIAMGVAKNTAPYMVLTKDMAYWLSRALLAFANTGKLP